MTKEEIISMAREAGIAYTNRVHPQVTEYATSEESISRFAALVEAAHTAKLLAGVEMPEPTWKHLVHGVWLEAWSKEQMREYAAGLVAKKDAELAELRQVFKMTSDNAIALNAEAERLSDHAAVLRTQRDTLKAENERLTAAVSEAERVEPAIYVRRDQLQKARVSPLLCELRPEPRQDCVPLYTTPPAAYIKEPT